MKIMDDDNSSIIIDGNNTAFRCDSVLNLYTHSGIRTSGLYGLLNTYLSLKKKYKGSFYFCWDKGRSIKRVAVYPSYKRKAELTPENKIRIERIYTQIDIFNEFLHTMGIPSLWIKGIEADDIIASLTYLLEGKKIIISTDNDFLQLINENVEVYNPVKKITYNNENFEELIGVKLKDFLLYKALIGDSSDNIPRVPRVGPVTAKKIVNMYGYEGIFNKNEINDKILQKVKDFRDQICLNLFLMDLSRDEELCLQVKYLLDNYPKEYLIFDKDRLEHLLWEYELPLQLIF